VVLSPLLTTSKRSDLIPKVIKVRDFKSTLRYQRDGSALLFITQPSSGSTTHSDVTRTDAASKDNFLIRFFKQVHIPGHSSMPDTICSKRVRMNGAATGTTYWDSYLLGSGKRTENEQCF